MSEKALTEETIDKLFKKAEVEIVTLGGKKYAIMPASGLQLFFQAGVDALGEAVLEKTKK